MGGDGEVRWRLGGGCMYKTHISLDPLRVISAAEGNVTEGPTG